MVCGVGVWGVGCEGCVWYVGCVVMVFIYAWVIVYVWRAMALHECTWLGPYGSHCGECVPPLTRALPWTAYKVGWSLVANTYTLEPDLLWFKSCLSPPWP